MRENGPKSLTLWALVHAPKQKTTNRDTGESSKEASRPLVNCRFASTDGRFPYVAPALLIWPRAAAAFEHFQ